MLEDRRREDLCPWFPRGGVVPGGKEGREAREGHKVRLANPIPIPATHLGNEGQLVDGNSETGRQVKVCLGSLNWVHFHLCCLSLFNYSYVFLPLINFLWFLTKPVLAYASCRPMWPIS